MSKKKHNWTKFKVYPEIEGNTIEAAYAKGDDGEYSIKLISKVPRGFYYSFLNDANHCFDNIILPTINNTQNVESGIRN